MSEAERVIPVDFGEKRHDRPGLRKKLGLESALKFDAGRLGDFSRRSRVVTGVEADEVATEDGRKPEGWPDEFLEWVRERSVNVSQLSTEDRALALLYPLLGFLEERRSQDNEALINGMFKLYDLNFEDLKKISDNQYKNASSLRDFAVGLQRQVEKLVEKNSALNVRVADLSRALEDVEDRLAAHEAVEEMERKGEKPVPWEQVKKELNL